MIVDGSKFNSATDVLFTKPKVNNSGSKNVGILNAKTKKSLYLSTPLMLTWGINENDFDGSGRKTYDLSLQFPRDQDSNFSEDTKSLLNSLEDYEKLIKSTAIASCKEWFGKTKMSEDVVDALFTPMLKYPKDQATGEPDKTRAPTLRVKIPYYDDVFKIELYDTERELLFPNVENSTILPTHIIEKGQNIAVVIQSGGMWFANGKFGTTWKLVQAVVQPRESLYGKCHINLDNKSKERLRKEAEEREVDGVDEVDTKVNDSDDDVDEHSKVEAVVEAVVEPVVEPVVEAVVEQVGGVEEEKHGTNEQLVEPKKKRVVKKKAPV